MNKIIILTGGTGFLGSAILRSLLNKNFKILLLKRSFSNLNRIKDLSEHKNLTICNIDVDNISKYTDHKCVYGLIHTATEYGRNSVEALQAKWVNYEFPISIIKELNSNNIEFIINTDTYYTKIATGYHLKEYRDSKKKFSEYLENISTKTRIVNLRLEHMYGPYDSGEKFIEWAIQKIAIENSNKISLTSGIQIRDFIYIDDVINAYIAVLRNIHNLSIDFHEFEVGTGVGTPISILINKIKKISNSNTILGFDEIEQAWEELPHSIADNAGLLAFDWSPKIMLVEGLQRIISLYKS